MKRPSLVLFTTMVLVALACGVTAPTAVPAPVAPEHSIFDSGRTAYGFFPSPPRWTSESIIATMQAIGKHGDVVLFQQAPAWQDFLDRADGPSKAMDDLKGMVGLAQRNGLESIFVVDALNGLDRRNFAPLPAKLAGADFGTPALRTAFKNYALRLVREFHPRAIGLGSEVNTYADAHPEDFRNYLSLYHEVYATIKAELPQTQVFVTFQWEDLNNVGVFKEGRPGYQINWETVEAFEPELDIWAISTYPFAAFATAREIPPNYYTRLLERTKKPLAVAEGGYISKDVSSFRGMPQDQMAYLDAIHSQIGPRLLFWIYLMLQDLDLAAYTPALKAQGMGSSISTLGLFASVGLRTLEGQDKPALALWDSLRSTP